MKVDGEPEVRVALIIQRECNEGGRRVVADAGVEGLLRSPGGAAVIRVGHPERVERLQHADVAAGGVLGQVGRDPGHEDASRVREAWRHDANAGRNRVAERVGLCNQRAADSPGCHSRAGEDLLRRAEGGAAVV